MPADSVKTEGQDYIRAGLPAPAPLIITNFIHGEFIGRVERAAPAEQYLASYIHGEFSHQFTARERSTLTGSILERHNLDKTITSSWAQT